MGMNVRHLKPIMAGSTDKALDEIADKCSSKVNKKTNKRRKRMDKKIKVYDKAIEQYVLLETGMEFMIDCNGQLYQYFYSEDKGVNIAVPVNMENYTIELIDNLQQLNVQELIDKLEVIDILVFNSDQLKMRQDATNAITDLILDLESLQPQETVKQGCEYKHDKKNWEIWCSEKEEAITNPSYCPMCGRKLGE